MTFKEKYSQESTWYGKCLVMEIYHLTMLIRHNNWTIGNTARDFECSIGLVSENLRLANLIHAQPDIAKLESRNLAIKKLR